jgi:hypothetical protein
MRTTALALGFVGAALATACRDDPRVAAGFHQEALMSLRPNSSQAEVRGVLGEPLNVEGRHAPGAEGKLFRWNYATPGCSSVAGWSFACRGWSAQGTVLQGRLMVFFVSDENGTLVYECSEVACPRVLDEAAFARLPTSGPARR